MNRFKFMQLPIFNILLQLIILQSISWLKIKHEQTLNENNKNREKNEVVKCIENWMKYE